MALERLGCDETELLYVGDSATDAEAAQRAGVPFVAVLSGVTPSEILRRYPQRAILDDVSCLPHWLEGHAALHLADETMDDHPA